MRHTAPLVVITLALSACAPTTPPLAQSHLTTYDNTIYPLVDAELQDRLASGTNSPVVDAIIRADLAEFRDALSPSPAPLPPATPDNPD